MLLRTTHETELTYTEPVCETVMELRMAPRQVEDQHRLSFSLGVGPRSSVMQYFDWMGNSVHAFSISPFHQTVRIVATSVVETTRPRAELSWLNDAWPLSLPETEYGLFDFLQFSGPIIDCQALRELADSLAATPGMPVGELLRSMLELMATNFTYEKGVTNFASPISEILEHKKGVCQDFAHLMIGLARALRIPARYVSGVVHPEENRYRGTAQTHAWVELLVPSVGWIGLDPTNRCAVGENFVKIAVGRDFRDVAPNRGLYRGTAKESIKVTVKTERLRNVPAQLAAERYEGIPIPTGTDENPGSGGMNQSAHQQERQQQQQRAFDARQQQQQQQQ